MEPKTQICPCCGRTMTADYEKYYGWVYTCPNTFCISKQIKNLKEKENETWQERARLQKARHQIVMEQTQIGKLLKQFKNVYVEEVNAGAIPLEIREILSMELENLSKM